MKHPPSPVLSWLSHLIEWPVEELSSEHNASLKVVLHRGRYKLITDGAIYSFSDLYANYRKTFEQLQWPQPPYGSCLILGLGMASIPDMLTTKFNKDLE